MGGWGAPFRPRTTHRFKFEPVTTVRIMPFARAGMPPPPPPAAGCSGSTAAAVPPPPCFDFNAAVVPAAFPSLACVLRADHSALMPREVITPPNCAASDLMR